MPGLQVGLLVFFLAVAILHFWYNWWLLAPCFVTGELQYNPFQYVLVSATWIQRLHLPHFLLRCVHKNTFNLMRPGLLGGAVYVNAFTLLSREVEPCLREFSLAAASLADSVGIALADICGVLIQVCPVLLSCFT